MKDCKYQRRASLPVFNHQWRKCFMKKVILALVSIPLAACLGIAHAQDSSDASVGNNPSRAEMRQQQADGIRSRKENVAGAHKKAQRDPATRKARQQQKEGRMEREKEIAGAHKKAKRDPASKAARQKQRDGMMERKSNISGAHQKARDARNESMQNN